MINFHKYGFLDVKKLNNLLRDTNYWLCQYNPLWLFIWSDLYKPEIAFTNDYCFIRVRVPDVGICYYPPIGENLKKGLRIIEEDARENGFDLAFFAVDTDLLPKFKKLGYNLYENKHLDSYIYTVEDFAFFKNKCYKNINKTLKQFTKDKNNPILCRGVRKEDFNDILAFIEKLTQSTRKNDSNFFARLNMLKKSIDHLYELDFLAAIIYDENGIYGLAIGSIFNNVTFIHYIVTLDRPGAYEYLLMTMARVVYSKSKYISLEFDNKDENLIEKYNELKPYKLEPIFASFEV